MRNIIKQPILRQLYHFVIHLRWHYQLFILSGGFLAGGFLSATVNWGNFIIQSLNVHLLLFGGATAYNSYWDKDEGAVGGLRHPPLMTKWMWPASILLQFAGLALALQVGLLYAGIYLLSMLLFWFYSSPHFRWKGRPVLSLIAIGISTGTNSLLMGYLSAGNTFLETNILVASLGVAFVILSLYPVSQLYQVDEDIQRGDKTFAIAFGFDGVIQFYRIAFTIGVLLLSLSIMLHTWQVGLGFGALSVAAGFWVDGQLQTLTEESQRYRRVMRIKYMTSIAFVIFFGVLLLLDYFRAG